jgi:hypothetical protein
MKWIFMACVALVAVGLYVTNAARTPPVANLGMVTTLAGLATSFVTGLLWVLQ